MERDGEIIANSLDAKGMEDLSSYYLETNEWKTEAILYEKHPLIKEACRGDNLRVIKTTSGNDKGKSTYNFFVIVWPFINISNFLIIFVDGTLFKIKVSMQSKMSHETKK